MNTTTFPAITALGNAARLAADWPTRLKPFWQAMQCGVLNGSDKLPLSYYAHLTPGAKQAVVISSGRMEMAVKYAELCYELVHAGYSVFLLDHRGQGLSGRELDNPDKGYVADFALYHQDMDLFIRTIVQPSAHQQYLALGHSMGCAILAGYIQHYRHPFSAAIFASPMFGIYTGLVPTTLAEALALAFGAVNRRLSPVPWYFPGQSNYRISYTVNTLKPGWVASRHTGCKLPSAQCVRYRQKPPTGRCRCCYCRLQPIKSSVTMAKISGFRSWPLSCYTKKSCCPTPGTRYLWKLTP